ncbi:hypothetical protein F3K44_32095 [Bacillus megaterium]|nr:hypothetical protein [Priestia megaterium]
MKSRVFTLVLIIIFLTYYIKTNGIDNVSPWKLIFIPAIFILSYFVDKALKGKAEDK